MSTERNVPLTERRCLDCSGTGYSGYDRNDVSLRCETCRGHGVTLIQIADLLGEILCALSAQKE